MISKGRVVAGVAGEPSFLHKRRARSFMRVAPRIVTLLASTAPLAVEAFSFLAFPLRIADQEHRHGWVRIAIHGTADRFLSTVSF
jgi:hypothetical protein